MEKLLIRGAPGLPLKGEVRMSGAKNAVLPAIAAALHLQSARWKSSSSAARRAFP
jgi:UDP-N-acetylglucosamine enolpyruvyl transferase